MESADLAPLRQLAEEKGSEKVQELLALESSTEGWEDLGVHDGVESARLYVPETGYYVLKGVGDIEQSIEAILRLITDVSKKAEWDQMFVEGRVVAELSDKARLSYQHFSAPWPVSHRDFTYISVLQPLEDGSVVSVAFSVETPLVPPVSKLVRGHMHIAGFVFRKVTPTLTRVTYIVHIDPKGSIPTMVINQSQKKQTQNISKIRNYLARTT